MKALIVPWSMHAMRSRNRPLFTGFGLAAFFVPAGSLAQTPSAIVPAPVNSVSAATANGAPAAAPLSAAAPAPAVAPAATASIAPATTVDSAVPPTAAVATPTATKKQAWFPGYGGLILGGEAMVVAPLGHAAGGQDSAMTRSHLPGLGVGLHGGLLFLRNFGVLGHLDYALHPGGTGSNSSASSSQLGLTARYYLLPERVTPFFDLGVSHNSFSSTVTTSLGDADRTTAAWDGRVGAGYSFLSSQEKWLLAPFVTFDFGKFGSVEQSLGHTVAYSIPSDQQAWHFVIGAGISLSFYGGIKELLGPVTNPNDPDGDGIDNAFDKCPTIAEDSLPPLIDDGCPSDDRDNDRVRDADDKCPTAKEDGLLPDAKDGCPTDDPDQDGVGGADDKCPTTPEDKLPPNPKDGCPSTDRDNDGIPNHKDACPDQPEVFNGIDDDDGCPDQGRVNYSQESNQITISEKIFFKKNSAEISRKSLSLVGEVAGTLKHMPQIELVEVAGHADATGKDKLNLQLTQARADSVRDALIDRGVDPRRLTSIGYGNYCPVAQGDDAETNEKNRRVEFKIVRIAGQPTGVKTTCDSAVSHGIKGTDPNGVGEASVAGSADPDPPSDAEVRSAIAKADASLLFPDYHGCAEGEPGLTRVVVLATKKVGSLWLTKVDGLVTSSSSHQPDNCWTKPEEGSRWKTWFGKTTTVTVHLMKIKKQFKVVLP